ncbi:CopY/TcrY family copper transport repressor [Bacillus kwashiorkori]|uniref:CopY/TcrY family copper transport repressor n=1 Tax=Bacillus kwashiorkori TaxID=1522318 RepID=UPI0007824D58|nr:CopY/TcrY family copper transport repressor [Bacillus kwashiorkori]
MNTEMDSKVTEAEWEIMRVVWAQNKVTSKEIIEVLQQKKDWKPATTKTFIGRLVHKGMLETETEGRKYIYSAKVKEADIIRSSLNELFANICSRDVGNTIAYLLSNATLSFKDIDKLEKILERKKKDAVEEVPCNCVPGQCKCHEHEGSNCNSGCHSVSDTGQVSINEQ